MRRSLSIVFILSLALLSKGQSYFNNHYLSGEWELGNSGSCTNLLLKDDTLMSFGGTYLESEFQRWFQFFNFSGDKTGELLVPEINENGYSQYNESIKPFIENSFIWGGALAVFDSLDLRPICVRYNSDLTVNWSNQINHLFANNDSVQTAEFNFAQPLANNDVFCAGPVYYNIDDDNWPDISGMLVARYSADGDSIYEKIIPFWQEQYDEFNEGVFRVNGAVELDNGDFIIASAWSGSNETAGIHPTLLKVSADGDFLGFFRFSILCADWLPWLLPLDNGNLAFAYSKCVDTYFPDDDLTTVTNIRIGEFDPDSMDTLWTKTFDHTMFLHVLHDFVKTPDDGYATLSFVTGTLPDYEYSAPRGAYILKMDNQFNEEWFRYIPEPIQGENGASLSAYDLEVTPDGGFAALGNFIPIVDTLDGIFISADYYVTWLFKTDCMGFLEPPDLQLYSNVAQLDDSTFYCTASGGAYQNFEWDFGNGDVLEGDTITYIYDESGEFEIMLNAGSCMAEGYSMWSVTATVGIEEVHFGSALFKLWPNPTTSILQIESDDVVHQVFLKDITGRIIHQQGTNSKFVTMDVSQLSPGLYLLEADLGNGKVSGRKVVVE